MQSKIFYFSFSLHPFIWWTRRERDINQIDRTDMAWGAGVGVLLTMICFVSIQWKSWRWMADRTSGHALTFNFIICSSPKWSASSWSWCLSWVLLATLSIFSSSQGGILWPQRNVVILLKVYTRTWQMIFRKSMRNCFNKILIALNICDR